MKTLALFLVLVALLIPPLAADPVIPTTTRVFITENGIPVDAPVEYTMHCYGTIPPIAHPETGWLSGHGITAILNASSDNTYRYAYSATCAPGRCDIYEVYDTWMMRISSCDISGTYKGQPFLIRNISRDPAPAPCRRIISAGRTWTGGLLYAVSREDEEQCQSEQMAKEAVCRKIIGIETIANADGSTTFKKTGAGDTSTEAQEKFRQCQDDAGTGFKACAQDRGMIVDRAEVENGSERYCELRFDIVSGPVTAAPAQTGNRSGSQVPGTAGTSDMNFSAPLYSPAGGLEGTGTSPVCRLLRIFGIAC